MIIAIDFDGTLAEHKYPKIGREVPGAIASCKEFQSRGVKLILWTMRSGDRLKEAVEWCKERGLEFWAINENPNQQEWTNSNKQYANMYVDDSAVGCPLKESKEMGAKDYVDWEIVRKIILERLEKRGF